MFLIHRLRVCAERDGKEETEEAVSVSLFETKDCKRIIREAKKNNFEETLWRLENVTQVCKWQMANGRIKRSISGFENSIVRSSFLLLVIKKNTAISLRR